MTYIYICITFFDQLHSDGSLQGQPPGSKPAETDQHALDDTQASENLMDHTLSFMVNCVQVDETIPAEALPEAGPPCMNLYEP